MAAMTVFDLRMERLSALAAAHVSRAELERLAGGEVE
jgi:hypothetical protein